MFFPPFSFTLYTIPQSHLKLNLSASINTIIKLEKICICKKNCFESDFHFACRKINKLAIYQINAPTFLAYTVPAMCSFWNMKAEKTDICQRKKQQQKKKYRKWEGMCTLLTALSICRNANGMLPLCKLNINGIE